MLGTVFACHVFLSALGLGCQSHGDTQLVHLPLVGIVDKELGQFKGVLYAYASVAHPPVVVSEEGPCGRVV